MKEQAIKLFDYLSMYTVGDDILFLPAGAVIPCHVVKSDEVRGMTSFRKVAGKVYAKNSMTGEEYEEVDYFFTGTDDEE